MAKKWLIKRDGKRGKGGSSSYRSQQLGRTDWRRVTEDYARAKIEITNLHRTELRLAKAKNVFGLEITVSNPLLMQELKSIGYITNYKAGFILGEMNPFLDVGEQRSAVNLLEHQVESKSIVVLADGDS